jgi:hypothetical protein
MALAVAVGSTLKLRMIWCDNVDLQILISPRRIPDLHAVYRPSIVPCLAIRPCSAPRLAF